MAELSPRIESLMERVDRISGGWASLVRQAFTRFLEMRATESAASLAYYALFALFPLTLLLVSVLGYVMTGDLAYGQAKDFIRLIFPFSGDLVDQNLREVIKQRGALSVIGAVGLLWSASGFFNTLAGAVNRAWPSVKLRGLVHSRLVALAMVGALILLLLLSLVSSTVINLLPLMYQLLDPSDRAGFSATWLTLARVIPPAFTFLMFIGMYQWVPNKVVSWKAVLTGATLVTLVWELAKLAFSAYLGSGLVNYQSVYGPLGTLIALMLWVYFSSLIALFGTYIVAGLDIREDQKSQPEPQELSHRQESSRRLHG